MNFLWQSKRFAQKLAEDWLTGCGLPGAWQSKLVRPGHSLRPGPVAMFGIQPESFPHWLQLRREGRDFYYIDNAYFSPGHDDDHYVRITKNALQCSGYGTSNLKRLAVHEIEIKDWEDPSLVIPFTGSGDPGRGRGPASSRAMGPGGKILITCQSGWWYIQHGTTLQAWLDRVVAEIRRCTDREIKVRLKPNASYQLPPNTMFKGDLTAPDDDVPFEADLAEAFCVVTHSSNTAIEAILAGVPAFVLGQCAAQPMACNDLKLIEAPFINYADRWNWAGVLADNQWTPKEIREGKAWADLNKKDS